MTSTATPAPTGSTRSGLIVAVLSGGGITVSVMQTLIVPLLPKLPSLLDTSAANASWAITATLLTSAVAAPVIGRLGDLYGKRRMLLLSTVALVLGSVLCALSDSLVPALVGRSMQGLGIAVIPLGISIMRDVLPPKRMLGGMAVMSASLGVGGALGLPLSSAVAQYADWHVLFWMAAALGVIFFVCVLRLVPEPPVSAVGRFDAVGAVTLSAGLLALLLAVSKGTDWGWTSRITLSLLGAAAVILLLWVRWETRADSPLVDLRTTLRPQVLLTNVASIVIGFTMYGNSLITPQLLQLPTETGHGLGQSLLAAGLWMAPGGLVMMAMSPVAARLSTVRGPKTSLLVGTLVIGSGYALAFPLMGSLVGVLLFAMVISTGVAFAFAAMPALIMGAVPQSEGAAANSLNSLMRSVGTTMASAVIGVVLAHLTTSYGTAEVPSLTGMRVGYGMGLAAAVVAAAITLAIPGRGRATASGAVPAQPSPAATARPSVDQPADGRFSDGQRSDGQPEPVAATGLSRR